MSLAVMGPSWEDDGEWQDMPVLRSSSPDSSSDEEDRRQKSKRGWRLRRPRSTNGLRAPPERIGGDVIGGSNRGASTSNAAARSSKRDSTHSNASSSSSTSATTAVASTTNKAAGNATGKVVDVDYLGEEWREKAELDEMDYTRLELDDDPDEDSISMRTQYLFSEDRDMTPLGQMQATKTLLTEGQRIAYVGLCKLVTRGMVQTLKLASVGAKELDPAVESMRNWSSKIMGRLYRHMEVDAAEQKMIEQLAEHGVTADDLVPSLATTHTVANPEYDPEVAKEMAEKEALDAELRAEEEAEAAEEQRKEDEEQAEIQQAAEELRAAEARLKNKEEAMDEKERERRRFEEEELRAMEEEMAGLGLKKPVPVDEDEVDLPSTPLARPAKAPPIDDGGDIGGLLDEEPATPKPAPGGREASAAAEQGTATPRPGTPRRAAEEAEEQEPPSTPPSATPNLPSIQSPVPQSLPGVSTNLTAADETVTLDIRWTVLCDLFLSLIADSVYDARSRVLLLNMATKLGLGWMDVVRFERRLTEALEIQEGVKNKEHAEIMEGTRKKGQRQRYMMMGAAAVGGGLVIGLSAGLLAPLIGAGLGAAFTTIGVTGTTSFLAGAGGTAMITSVAVSSGSAIGGRAMAKRTRNVKTFDFLPIHNNKRVNYYITIPGFMSGPQDDVRLPYSVIDPVMGDVFSLLWEPDMMGETGNALRILTSEVLTQVGQQVLAMTVMTALLSALQWPIMLTKLGYLIDNPWSNALDRARQGGKVLAGILLDRRLGVRPVSLVGFSLGARLIFYCLVELAKAKAFGVVQEVYLFGATLTASSKMWRQARGIVAGRFVNGYARNDWVLGYLFRATTGGLSTVAGLRPIEHVPELENVDVTDIIVGHMSYRTLMPQLLAHVGFKVTDDKFDEPDEMDLYGPEREIVTKEEEEARRLKKEQGRFGFLRRKKTSSSQPGSEAMSRETSTEGGAGDDEDLPPRVEAVHKALEEASDRKDSVDSSSSPARSSTDSTAPRTATTGESKGKAALPPAPSVEELPPPSPTVPDTVGFDLEKLREELAKSEAAEKPIPELTTSGPLPPPPPPSKSGLLPAAPVSSQRRDDEDDPTPIPRSIPVEAPASDDPRELLRRPWAGEAAPSSPITAAPPVEYAWGSASAVDLSVPPAQVPTFTFGSNDGASFGSGWDDEITSRPRGGGSGRGQDADDEEAAPDPAGSFVWGGKNASSATLGGSNNPW